MILPQDLKALVVDDNAYARAAVAATLRKLGLVSIDELTGAAAAVGAIQATRYDIMFMDWYMPEMNGAALLEVIRDPRFSAHGRVPVVMITAYPNRETMARARQLGAGEVLTKPFTIAHAAAALARLLPDGWQIPADADPGQVLL
ncbi:response regulator [Devosia sp. A16]|uniref:response regulator n=1 Tax=Devosia sp. A16 TaxID=1736675 RepID=UPI0006D775A8|nr:response regulator [Devosia sp. A16]